VTTRPAGFAPLGGPRSTLLILGSFPGVASLERREYYGFARNRFWPLMEQLFGVAASGGYPERCRALVASRVALWDVLASCEREGSRDDRIALESAVPNPVAAFLGRHRAIVTVALNGGLAHRAFKRWIQPTLGARAASVRVVALPSTSPLNARMDLRALERHWRRAIEAPR
jgi:TDG/mug DNA glycosylase family protein